MVEERVYIHLGLPKTASTFVQETVFPRLQGLHFFPKHSYALEEAKESSVHPKLLTCEKDEELHSELDRISNEIPDARIILVFREPYSWLVSKYKYSIRKHGARTFGAYLEHLAKDQGIRPGFYRSVIDRLNRDFSGKHLVLDFSEFREDPRRFIGRIETFTGASFTGDISDRIVKPAFSDRKLVRLLRFNKAYPYEASASPNRMIRSIHYKYREFLLHIVAFFSGLMPADTSGFTGELAALQPKIASEWEKDWQAVCAAAAADQQQ